MDYLRSLSNIFSRPSYRKQKVIVSPGFRKCASTSLQYMLRSNEQILSPYFHVSCKDELTQDWRRALHEITVKGRKSSRKQLPAIAKKMAQELSARSGENGFVISDENLVGFKLITKRGDTIFDISAQVLPILERAFRRFDVTFHFQTRDMRAWIKSAHAHEVWMRTETRTLEEFSDAHSDKLDWHEGYNRVARALSSPVNFVDISTDKFRGTVGKSLLEYFDVPQKVVSSLTIPELKNPSPTPEDLETKRRANSVRLIERQARREKQQKVGKLHG